MQSIDRCLSVSARNLNSIVIRNVTWSPAQREVIMGRHSSSRSGGSSARHGHSKSSKRKDRGRENPFSIEYFWFCCQCGDGPGTNLIDHCVMCQALRCSNCRTEAVKLRAIDAGGSAPAWYYNHPSSLDSGHAPQTLPMGFSTLTRLAELLLCYGIMRLTYLGPKECLTATT